MKFSKLKPDDLKFLREILRKYSNVLANKLSNDTIKSLTSEERMTIVKILAKELISTGVTAEEINERGIRIEDLIDFFNPIFNGDKDDE